MAEYYPMMLNLSEKQVVVIGGGKVATRKILTLLEAHAHVTVISPELEDKLVEQLPNEFITWKRRLFEPADLKDAFLIIAATNDASINFHVYENADKHQLINVVDRPDLSNFIVPASLRRGKLTISVSTSGASPSLAKKIKQDLAMQYDEIYEDYLLFLGKSRQRVLKEVTDINKRVKLLQELLHPMFLELTRQDQYVERERCLQELLKRGIAP